MTKKFSVGRLCYLSALEETESYGLQKFMCRVLSENTQLGRFLINQISFILYAGNERVYEPSLRSLAVIDSIRLHRILQNTNQMLTGEEKAASSVKYLIRTRDRKTSGRQRSGQNTVLRSGSPWIRNSGVRGTYQSTQTELNVIGCTGLEGKLVR